MQNLNDYINEGLIRDFFKSLKRLFFGPDKLSKGDYEIKDKKTHDERAEQLKNDKDIFFKAISNAIKENDGESTKPGTVLRVDYLLSDSSKNTAKYFKDNGEKSISSNIKYRNHFSIYYVLDKISYDDLNKSYWKTNVFQYINGGPYDDKTFNILCQLWGFKQGLYFNGSMSLKKTPLIQLWDIARIRTNNNEDINAVVKCLNSHKDKEVENIIKTIQGK